MPIYHVFNRGVEKRAIVMDDTDRIRFVHDLYYFNDVENADPNHRFKKELISNRTPLVHVHAWALMHNHYHFLLTPVFEDGLALFLKKFNGGYAKYFNERYARSGALWQGKTKRVLINTDAHFLHIPYYIHLNPLDYIVPQWRSGKVRDSEAAIKALEKYRWSSHLDYFGERNFPSIIYTRELQPFLGTRGRYLRGIENIIQDPHAGFESGIFDQ